MIRLTVLLLIGTAAFPAAGQSALKGHNSDAPINIDAQTLDGQDDKGQARFSGDVRITQGDMKLDADAVTVFYSHAKKGGDPVIERLDAQNNVKLVTPGETATGHYGIYDATRRTVTLVGAVTLTHGDSVLRGQRLAIDLDSGRSRLDGANTGPTGTPGATGRVSGRFVVPERKTN